MKLQTASTKVFYSTASAMQIELSKNGFFVTIAKAKLNKNTNGNTTFDWTGGPATKGVVKLSEAEISWLLEAVKAYMKDDDYFIHSAGRLFGEKYKNFLFVHRNKNGQQVQTGLSLYNKRLQFVIRNQTNKQDLFFSISMIDTARMVNFFQFILNMNNHTEMFNKAQQMLNKNDDFVSDIDGDFTDQTPYRDSDFNSSF